MKKILTLFLIFSFLFSMPMNVFAAEQSSLEVLSSEYTYFEDGSYIVTTLVVERIELDTSNGVRSDSESYILKGHRYANGYDSNDELDWVVTLTGEFLVCPTCPMSGQCQSSKLSAVFYDTSWGMYDVDERCMSNNAYGACSMKDKFLGITTKIVELEMILTCDRYGNLSVLGQ